MASDILCTTQICRCVKCIGLHGCCVKTNTSKDSCADWTQKTLRLLSVRVLHGGSRSISMGVFNISASCENGMLRTLSGGCAYAYEISWSYLICTLDARLLPILERGRISATLCTGRTAADPRTFWFGDLASEFSNLLVWKASNLLAWNLAAGNLKAPC